MQNCKSNSVLVKVIQLIGAAFIAKGLGFIRELVLAYYYGTSYVSDVFVAAQNIPAIIFTVFGTAVTTGFIPLYTELKTKKNKEEADQFANNVFNIFGILAVILTILGIIFSQHLVTIFGGGFADTPFELCNHFAKIIMATSIAITLAYVYNAYLQIEGYFNQNSLMNIPYNIVQIVFIIWAFYSGNPYILAIGLLIASYSQLIYLRLLIKKKTKFKHSLILNLGNRQITQMIIIVGPVFISTGVNQLNCIVDRALASSLVEGSVSALNYSSEVANIITHVIILSLTTILYPRMTLLFAENKEIERNKFMINYLNTVSFLVLPLATLIFFFSEEIVRILFGRGAFTETTVIFVGRALRIYAIGIIGASFRDVFNKMFYSMKNTVTPMVNGVITVGLNIGLNFLLIGKYKYLGLAFATSISVTVCTILMFIQLKRKMFSLNIRPIAIEFLKVGISTIGMFVILTSLSKILCIDSDILRCIIYGVIGVISYLILLIILREQIVYDNILSKLRREA